MNKPTYVLESDLDCYCKSSALAVSGHEQGCPVTELVTCRVCKEGCPADCFVLVPEGSPICEECYVDNVQEVLRDA